MKNLAISEWTGIVSDVAGFCSVFDARGDGSPSRRRNPPHRHRRQKPKQKPKLKPRPKGDAKAAATKLAGDVGLLDTEKNYMIIVTKEGKLVTVDYDAKFQPTQRELNDAKVADIGLGSAATVLYVKEGDKSIATSIEFLPAKGE